MVAKNFFNGKGLVLAGTLHAAPKDRLDNWKPRDWPFSVNNPEITRDYLNDVTTKDLSTEQIELVNFTGEELIQDLPVWQAAQQDASLREHNNFAEFDKEFKNYNKARKAVIASMQQPYTLLMESLYIIQTG